MLKISLITVCLNSEKTITHTLRSVAGQSYANIEHIVIDGGSRDRTPDIISQHGSSIDFFLSESDRGLYDAMNKGIARATGDVVGILNSDDFFFSPLAVEQVADAFADDVDAVSSDLVYVSRACPWKSVRYYSSRNFAPWKIRFGLMVPHPTFYARRKLFEDFGLYDLTYRIAADFELMARFFSQGIRFRTHANITVAMRDGGLSSGGIVDRVSQNMEIARACRTNKIKTTIPLIAAKLPLKVMSFLQRRKHAMDPCWRDIVFSDLSLKRDISC